MAIARFPTTWKERQGPFHGPGMVVFFANVPVTDLTTIGCNWFRIDDYGWDFTQSYGAAVLANKASVYGANRCLLTLNQGDHTDGETWAKTVTNQINNGLAAYTAGFRCFEFCNEWTTLGTSGTDSTAAGYATRLATFMAGMPRDCIIFGGCDERAATIAMINACIANGTLPDAISVHNYADKGANGSTSATVLTVNRQMAQRYQMSVISTEIGMTAGYGDTLTYANSATCYTNLKTAMGEQPFAKYAAIDVDGCGMYDYVDVQTTAIGAANVETYAITDRTTAITTIASTLSVSLPT